MAVAFGRYELLKKIASGGMGQVFLARTAQQGFSKLVVIKRILPHLVEDEEFITMFFDEAGIAARLNHPNLVQIFDLGEAGGSHYLAMEYVAGDDIRRVEKAARKQGRSLPLGVICRIVADAAAGLDYAHKATDPQGRPLKLVHRDVSPQNVLVGFDGGVKLIDFGVARAAGRAQHTATGILKGKYPYMSPEQIAGESYDHRSDQFALGTVMWELLTGKRLFKGDSDLVTMRLVRECQVTPPSRVNASLPPGLDAVVLKALSPVPAQRFSDCGELRMALEEFAVHERLPSTPAHLAAFMRELYADRIAAETDTSSLDELSGASAFDEKSQPSNASVPSKAQPKTAHQTLALGPAELARPPTRLTQQLTGPKTQGRKGMGFVAAAAAVVVVAVVALTLPKVLQGEAEEVPPPVTEVVEVAPAPTPTPTPTPTEPQRPGDLLPAPAPAVSIALVSTPPGAQVTVDGQPHGATPTQLVLDAQRASARVTFALGGYEPQQRTVDKTHAPALSVELKKRRSAGQTKPRDEAPPLGIKTGR